jgi:hypothetical protein
MVYITPHAMTDPVDFAFHVIGELQHDAALGGGLSEAEAQVEFDTAIQQLPAPVQ